MKKTKPLPTGPRARAKILSNIERRDGCWNWQALINRDGYGLVWLDGASLRAHRVSYAAFVGEIPDGMVMDHLCRNRRCVNPAHLEPVTNRENVLRGESPTALVIKTGVCKRGLHEKTPENTSIRGCRACSSDADRRRREAMTPEQRQHRREVFRRWDQRRREEPA